MRQVCVKITVPDELEPRVVALSRRLGVSFDIMVEILMTGMLCLCGHQLHQQSGYSTGTKSANIRIVRRSRREGEP